MVALLLVVEVLELMVMAEEEAVEAVVVLEVLITVQGLAVQVQEGQEIVLKQEAFLELIRLS